METKEPDSRLSVRKEDLDDQELYRLNQVINDLYSKVSTARDETADAVGKFVRSGVISSANDQSAASLPPLVEGEIPQPQSGDWALKSVVYSAGEDGLQYGFASAQILSKPAIVDYYSMFIQDYSSGYVNTSGTTVTLTSASKEAGNTFENCKKDQVININSVAYILAADAVAPFESVTITSTAGTQTNVYFNLNPIDGGVWEEIASDAEAGTWQPRPPTGWDVPCCLTASTKDQKTYQPEDGINYKRLVFAPWANAPQVTNFSVTIQEQDPTKTDIPSGKFVVNFTKPLDPEYYYASIERLLYLTAPNPTPPYWVGTQNIGATARVDVSGSTITYNGTLNDSTFTGQYFTNIQPGDTVYVGTASTLTDANTYTVSQVLSNSQLTLTTSPPAGTNILFAQWGRMAGEVDPFTQTDYWPLPTSAEYWKFRSRSVNHREIANNTTPPEYAVTVPASGGITPLTPATQLGSGDWSLNALQYSTDEAGNSSIFISATITTPAANADYYSLFWQRTSTPVSGDWIEIAADATAGTWQEWPSAGATYVVAIAANKNTYKLDQPDESIPSYYKSLVIPAWGPADQVTNFSVQIETVNRAGVPSGRFAYKFTKPNDPDYYYAQISRIATDSGYNPITANATALTSAQNGAMFEITSVGSTNFTLIGASANTVGVIFMKTGGTGTGSGTVKTAYGIVAGEVTATTQTDWWPLPATAEYWTFKSESVNYRKEVNTTSPPTFNLAVSTTSSGITQIAPATITTAAFASTIRPVELVATLPTLPSASYPQGAVVFLTTNNKLYRSTGSTWTVATDGADIVANSITGGKIAAGAISTTELFAGEILVGQGGGKPTRFKVVDSSSNTIGFIGDDSSIPFVGAYFVNLRIGPNISTPIISASSSGVTIDGAPLTLNLNGITTSINNGLDPIGSTYAGLKIADNTSGWYSSYRATSLILGDSVNARVRLSAGGGSPDPGGSINVNDTSGITTISLIGGTGAISCVNLTATGTITFPTGASNGYVWTSNASGVGSWQAASGSSQWTTSGSDIYRLTGNVGIGTATPGQKLTVTGTASISGVTGIGETAPSKGLLSVYGQNGFAYTPFNIVASARFRTGANSAMLIGTTTGNTSGWTRGIFWTYQLEDIAFTRFKDDETAAPINDFYISQSGNVGVGTTAPDALFTVNTIASFGDGAAATPSIAHKGDLNTGLWFPAVDTIAISTDGAERWRFNSSGMLIPGLSDTYDIGILASSRVRGVYTKIVDTAQSGATGDYIQTRKLQLFDNTGSTSSPSFWDMNVVMSGIGALQDSYFYMRDNGGNKVFQSERIRSGSAVDRTFWYTDLLPDTNLGQSIGSTSFKWQTMYANQLGDSLNPVIVYGGNSTFSQVSTGSFQFTTSPSTGSFLKSDATGYVSWSTISTQLSAGSGISLSGSTTVTITNSGVTSITGTTSQVIASASTGSVTLSLPQSIATTSNVTFNNLTLANGNSNGVLIKDTGGTARVCLTIGTDNNLYLDNNDSTYDIYIRPATGRYTFVDGSYFAPFTNNGISLGYNGQAWSNVYSYAYWAHDGTSWNAGWTGTFSTGGSTVYVYDGIITNVV